MAEHIFMKFYRQSLGAEVYNLILIELVVLIYIFICVQ